VKINRRFDIQ
jgi:hypothetical protein